MEAAPEKGNGRAAASSLMPVVISMAPMRRSLKRGGRARLFFKKTMAMEKIIKYLERRVTGWQEKRD